MDRDALIHLFESVRSGGTTPDAAVAQLAGLPFTDLGFARLDTHRDLRCGFPEVVFCEGKTGEEIGEIAARLLADGPRLLATRADPRAFEAVRSRAPDAVYHQRARIVTVERSERPREGLVLVLSAGTADTPVAEEARITAEMLGAATEKVYDCGVAGIHRVLGEKSRMDRANAVVVVAGMEGALASVVGGITDRLVVAVPTSVGYGASFSGLAPLLTMMNSCAAGVTVVNIDNGFGGGYAAALVNRLVVRAGSTKGAGKEEIG